MAVMDRAFRGLRALNTEHGRTISRLRHRMMPGWTDDIFDGEGLPDRLARSLGAHNAIDLKEFCEAFEFFERTRKHVRAPVVADLCCGHGLTGLLFAAFEKRVEQVVLVDRRRPKAFDRVHQAVVDVAPWVAAKIDFREARLRDCALPEGASVLGVHACGVRTDQCIDQALKTGGAVALMPCCYDKAAARRIDSPFLEALGVEQTLDIERTVRLRGAGYAVEWSAIPRCITPMNRVLLGVRAEP